MSFITVGHDNKSSLVDKINIVERSVVGVGIHTPLEARKPQLIGTGFVVGDGSYVVTNYHVVSKELSTDIVQKYVALDGEGRVVRSHYLEIIGIDPVHDLAILQSKSKMTPIELAQPNLKEAGTEVFFTGFPLGAVLGLYPATHVGLIAAVAPDVNPSKNADQLTLNLLSRLKNPFLIYQLDATAYPGNSGSPVFDMHSSEVIAVINKVFVSAGKEAAITNPSGISYAIPIKHVYALAKKHGIKL
ncbi:S1 family peptidase [Agaribacter flavus]|uniref:Serine protease n=1 Tax=Agaribacter flavus TaxID=1902781 RepID=A0ABV7FRT4_9ALTE